VAKEFTVTLLRGLMTFFFLAAVARAADWPPSGAAQPADATLEQASSEQSPGLTVRSDSDPGNFAANSEEGSGCQSSTPSSLKLSDVVGSYKVSCRGHVFQRGTNDAAALRAASRLSIQIDFGVWRC
jgi:hypothetical protein